MWTYNATVVRWRDADTVVVDVDLGFHVWLRNIALRLARIDSEELKSPDVELRHKAQIRKARCEQLAPAGSLVTVNTQRDVPIPTFDRYMAEVSLPDGRNVSDVLLSEGVPLYKRAADGGTHGRA